MKKTGIRIKRVLFLLLISLSVTGIYSFWPRTYKWVFVYYLSYDNDLNYLTEKVLGGLGGGISNKKIAVVAQADSIDVSGMKRIALYYFLGITERKHTLVYSEDSADPNELKKYLDWVRKKWKAKNYCVVLANHGGLLNSICQDEKPFRNEEDNKKYPNGKWLPADKVGEILADFNRSVGGKVRLLFFQQCGRASIQNLYSFTDTSEYLLASPVRVGGLNTYYVRTLKTVTNEPEMTGKKLAETIMKEDESYNIYTLIKTDKMKELPEKLAPVIDAFMQAENLAPANPGMPMFEYEGDNFYDFQTYMRAMSFANDNIGDNEIETFFDWCDNELIESVSFKDYKPDSAYFKTMKESWHCGLSIYVPSKKEELGRYDSMPLYKQTNLEDIMRLMFE